MSESIGPHLYLDPLLPVTIRRAPLTLPATSSPDTTSYLVLVWEGSVENPIAGTESGVSRVATGATRRPLAVPAGKKLVSGPVLIWSSPATRARLGTVEGWFVAVGHRVLQDITVGFYGEPGLCRFLDELEQPGWSPMAEFERERLDAIASSLADELDRRPPAYRARVRSLFSDLLLLIYRATLSGDADDHASGYRLSDVIDYIEDSYSDQLSLSDLAGILDCSPAYFSRMFSREVGVPPFEYINRVRVRHACSLLRSTQRSITEIAFEVGYNNVSFFNRYFRRIMQRTPREYRRYVQG
jgi:AraC-like DNA-binding protein